MTTYFLSDLHLDAHHPAMVDLFVNFLQHQTSDADAVYILGDLFEVWIGDDYQAAYLEKIIAALSSLRTQNIPVYFMHGNRDFLVGKRFAQQTGMQLLTDPCVIDLYGVPTLLTHGDLLCTDDQPYLEFRKKVRKPINQNIYLALPLLIRRAIARLLRKLSQNRAKQNNYQFIDANFAEIKRQMQQYNTQLIIHGHTHMPCIQYFLLDNKWVERITLSDWEGCGNVLVCKSDGERRLEYFDDTV